MANNFLLEIGTEEIPSSFVAQALEDLKRRAEAILTSNRLHASRVRTMGTPRRLALFADGLEDRQSDLVQEVTGPPRSVAFDEQGNPTKALEKFCQRYGAGVSDVSFVQKGKGEYVLLQKTERGRSTQDLLEELLPGLVLSIPFPKSMRWSDLDIRFVRPIHWILALYGDRLVRVQIGDVESASFTVGHRFLARNPRLPVGRASDYPSLLEANGVVLDPEVRKQRIRDQADRLAAEAGGRLLADEGLVEALAFLTEFPVALRGTFDPSFLDLPEEVLIAPMKGYQRYFPVFKGEGQGLLPCFVAIANIDPGDLTLIRRGTERVLKARLEDAKFFFEEDTRKGLDQNVGLLKQVIFHKKLGTSYDKVQRIRELAGFLGERTCPELLPQIQRAAELCKADLVTQMVGEFPELQGIMGGIYAAHAGEPAEVALAIREHYLPLAGEGALPTAMPGAVVGLADKMDTVVGYFGIGTPVSGNSDPFGLRRRTIGILRILLEKDIELSLSDFIRTSEDILGVLVRKPRDEVFREVLDFFRQRYQPMLLAKGFPYDTIDAVLSQQIENLPDSFRRIEALHRMRTGDPEFENLMIGCKRAVNILQQAEREFGFRADPKSLRPERLSEEVERDLLRAVAAVEDGIAEAMKLREYSEVLRALVRLKEPIDRFFDGVMVLVEDPQKREERLSLLHRVSVLFQNFADFSKVVL